MNRVRKLSAGALALVSALVVLGAAPTSRAEPVLAGAPAPQIEPVVLAEIPHDPDAFTQGLELAGPVLYEGTGLAGQSELRMLDPATGQVERSAPIPGNYFGEGITVVGDRIWQLTYRDGVAVQWDRATLTPLREVPLDGEGWGLCADGQRLIRSDGTDRLRFHDPADMREVGGVDVTRDGRPVTGLNELECVDGEVWANVWPTDTIVRVDPGTGAVDRVVDAAGLRARGIPASAQVLNGIAHLTGDEFLVTGKDWPTMFRVRLG